MYFYFMLPEIQMKEHISFTDMQVLNKKGETKRGILTEYWKR
jgi:hypothetical protein